jgi:hypothetical protein
MHNFLSKYLFVYYYYVHKKVIQVRRTQLYVSMGKISFELRNIIHDLFQKEHSN